MKRLKFSPAGGTVVCEDGQVRGGGGGKRMVEQNPLPIPKSPCGGGRGRWSKTLSPSPNLPAARRNPRGRSAHLDLVEQILVADVAVVLQEFHHDLAHVDLLLHQGEDGRVLLAGLHQDVVGEGCGAESGR